MECVGHSFAGKNLPSIGAGNITRKDGGILTLVKHEPPLQSGVGALERFFGPTENPQVIIHGDQFSKYPKL
ncbi:MAG: hypothetical protein ACPGSB_08310 [Opitutales bacterium]